MPDWIRNTMVVWGKFEALQEFMQDLKQEDTSQHYKICESLFPCPPELYQVEAKVNPEEEQSELAQRMESKYGVANWYEWQQKHWGLKWGDCETIVEHETYNEVLDDPDLDDGQDLLVRFRFETAWDAPVKVFDRISKMFPKLQFEILSIDTSAQWKRKFMLKEGLVSESELDYNPFWDE